MSGRPDGEKVPFNETLDHLQARRPFLYNLASGSLIGLAALLLGAHPVMAGIYALTWAALRAFLWGEGRILRRQYEVRLVRVAHEREVRRRRT